MSNEYLTSKEYLTNKARGCDLLPNLTRTGG